MLKNTSLGAKWVLAAVICFSTLTLYADPSDRVARLSRIDMNIKPVPDTASSQASRFKPSEKVLKRGALTKYQVPQSQQRFQTRELGAEKIQKNLEPKTSSTFLTLQLVKPSKPRGITKDIKNIMPERALQMARKS
ncbi:MAG TPA: hypothetical protein PLD88_00310, partial [Candidatus Berkiella sp.]|nr:hypothetical protein [Candidatus Berkiella sp.]